MKTERGENLGRLLREFYVSDYRTLAKHAELSESHANRVLHGKASPNRKVIDKLVGHRKEEAEKIRIRIAWERDQSPHVCAENDELRSRVAGLEGMINRTTPREWELTPAQQESLFKLLEEARGLPYPLHQVLDTARDFLAQTRRLTR